MVDRIGSSTDASNAWQALRKLPSAGPSDLLREARALQEEARQLATGGVRPDAQRTDLAGEGSEHGLGGAAGAARGSAFDRSLTSSASEVAEKVRALDQLPSELAAGRVDSLSELAAQVKTADLSFRFALEVRNKLIDAYREVMRMSV